MRQVVGSGTVGLTINITPVTDMIAPRLTRPGLAGDLLQAFDRTVKLSRKLPRGPLPRWALERAAARLDATQQDHGGWFSSRPTMLSLIALRVVGAQSDDERIVAVPQGLTSLDVALAHFVYRTAVNKNLGTEVDWP